MNTTQTLSDVVAPLPLEEFLGTVWNREFRYIPGHPEKFAALLPWEELSRLVTLHRLTPPRLKLVKEGQGVPANDWVQKWDGKPDTVIPHSFLNHLRDGASLVLDGIHDLYEPIGRLAGALERVLHESVNVNTYAGWRTNNGFDLHWDGHEVLVLQVAGRKRWRVYGPGEKHPLKGGGIPGADPPTELVWEGVIQAGDVLYIPRGWWHVAFPLDEPSLHLTVGIRTRTGLDLLSWVAHQLEQSELYRQTLPRFTSATTRQEHVQRLREELLAHWDDALLDRYLADHDQKAEPRPHLGLPWSAMPDLLPPSDDYLVEFTTARRVRLEEGADGGVQFLANGRRWRFAAGARPLIEALAREHPVSIASLIEQAAPAMDRDQVRRLLGKMVKQALVGIAGPVPVEAPPLDEVLAAD